MKRLLPAALARQRSASSAGGTTAVVSPSPPRPILTYVSPTHLSCSVRADLLWRLHVVPNNDTATTGPAARLFGLLPGSITARHDLIL